MVSLCKLEREALFFPRRRHSLMAEHIAWAPEQELNFSLHSAPWQGVLDSEQPVQLHMVGRFTALRS